MATAITLERRNLERELRDEAVGDQADHEDPLDLVGAGQLPRIHDLSMIFVKRSPRSSNTPEVQPHKWLMPLDDELTLHVSGVPGGRRRLGL